MFASLNPFKRSVAKSAPLPMPSVKPPAQRARPSRMRTAVRNMFTAAKSDRLNSSWDAFPVTADDIVDRNQRTLVARSREQALNNDYARQFLRMCRSNIVGPGGVLLQAQSRDEKGNLDALANEAILNGWNAWGHRKNASVNGRQSWREIQNACVQSAAKDGEFFVRKIYGKDAGPWGFSLQVLDPVHCPVHYSVEGRPGEDFIRQGIVFNRYGRPLAYLFTTTDETQADYRYGGEAFISIPADEIIHGFVEDMVGQKRGLPWMATGLFRMRNLTGLEDAALVNARIGASKMGFIEWEAGFGPELDDDEVPEIEAEPGVFENLPEGAKLRDWSPQYPSGEFGPFHKTMLRGISAGFGVAYNNLANDLEGVNFSSIRQGTLDEREHWKELQEWLIDSLIQPVFEAWLPRALLGGRLKVKGKSLKPERLELYSDVSWQPRRWSWIDPAADVKAAVDSKNNLLMSPGGIIREQGRDPSNVWRDIAADIAAMKAAGIPENFIQMAMGQTMQGVAGQKPDTSKAKKDDEKTAA